MAITQEVTARYGVPAADVQVGAGSSAIAWPAIFGGTVVAIGISIALVLLGSGLGMAVVSPWPSANPSVAAFSIGAAVWLIIVQWLASALGGYVTGRLRTRWLGTPTHEVFFRDTAHGLLVWAASTSVVVLLLALASGGILNAASEAGGRASVATAGQNVAGLAGAPPNPVAYDVDVLFRTSQPQPAPIAGPGAGAGANPRAEAARILEMGLVRGSVPVADRLYLTQLVATAAAISPADAGMRVDDVIAREQTAEAKLVAAANTARKGAAEFAIFGALALVMGAFVGCIGAALGGRERDMHT